MNINSIKITGKLYFYAKRGTYEKLRPVEGEHGRTDADGVAAAGVLLKGMQGVRHRVNCLDDEAHLGLLLVALG